MLISFNPKTEAMLVADYAALANKCIIVVDNSKYHTLSADKKAEVFAWYEDVMPEAEIDRIFELKTVYYYFPNEQSAVDNCYDWFPQPQNCPDADHHIPAYVIKPNGGIPYVNADPTPPGEG